MKKLKSSGGFSLAETLLAVLILLLVSVIVANGTPAAREAYEKVVIGANAKVLLSTTISSLRNELTTARNVDVKDSTTITYYSADKGQQSKIYLEGTPSVIMIQEYNTGNPAGFVPGAKALPTAEPRMLVSQRAATGDLYVTYESVSYSKGDRSITVNNLAVCRKSKPGVALATAPALTIRFIKPDATPTSTPVPTLTP